MDLFHRVPEGMHGHILYPPSQLKKYDPVAYNFHEMKYDGREWVRTLKVPGTNLVWEDFLQLSAVPPRVMQAALQKAKQHFFGEFYRINPYTLDQRKMRVFLYSHDVYSDVPELDPDEFVAFDINHLGAYSALSQATLDYYETFLHDSDVQMESPSEPEDDVFVGMKSVSSIKMPRPKGELFPWYRTVHILYSGTIDIKTLPRVII